MLFMRRPSRCQSFEPRCSTLTVERYVLVKDLHAGNGALIVSRIAAQAIQKIPDPKTRHSN